MSDIKVNNITSRDGNHGPIVAGVSTVASTGFMIMPSGSTEIRDAGSGRGVIWANNAPSTKTLNKIEISTTGNATDFGDSKVSKGLPSACASSTRGIFSGGQPGASPYYITDIEYVVVSSGGGGNDFGDLTQRSNYTIDARRGAAAGSNDSTRGLIAGGNTPGDGGARKSIDFITMASTGDSSDFGELVQERFDFSGGMGNGVRAVFAGGYKQTSPAATFYKIIDTVNVQSTGNATKFGELSQTKGRTANTSNSIRGLNLGGGPGPSNRTNIIEFITLSTEGNAEDFGDLAAAVLSHASCASGTRAVQIGGSISSGNTNAMQHVTIATTGNAVDFGDMTVAQNGASSISDVNGGLG
tara:strand:+ start:384 stop:1451 length:1068 start_codon:yes stop_codon:yes gene_type:complete